MGFVLYWILTNGLLVQRFRNLGENNPQTFIFPIAYKKNDYTITCASTYLRAQQIITQTPTMCEIMQYMSFNTNYPAAASINIMTVGF